MAIAAAADPIGDRCRAVQHERPLGGRVLTAGWSPTNWGLSSAYLCLAVSSNELSMLSLVQLNALHVDQALAFSRPTDYRIIPMREALRSLALPANTESTENTFRASSMLRVPLALLARPVKGKQSGDREHWVLILMRQTQCWRHDMTLTVSGASMFLVKTAAAVEQGAGTSKDEKREWRGDVAWVISMRQHNVTDPIRKTVFKIAHIQF